MNKIIKDCLRPGRACRVTRWLREGTASTKGTHGMEGHLNNKNNIYSKGGRSVEEMIDGEKEKKINLGLGDLGTKWRGWNVCKEGAEEAVKVGWEH